MLAKHIIGKFEVFLGGLDFFDPLEEPLEIADYMFCPHKKITSRTIRNNGALIVKF
jgi:hypothetical protein